jgi:hypothetical protein
MAEGASQMALAAASALIRTHTPRDALALAIRQLDSCLQIRVQLSATRSIPIPIPIPLQPLIPSLSFSRWRADIDLAPCLRCASRLPSPCCALCAAL